MDLVKPYHFETSNSSSGRVFIEHNVLARYCINAGCRLQFLIEDLSKPQLEKGTPGMQQYTQTGGKIEFTANELKTFSDRLQAIMTSYSKLVDATSLSSSSSSSSFPLSFHLRPKQQLLENRAGGGSGGRIQQWWLYPERWITVSIVDQQSTTDPYLVISRYQEVSSIRQQQQQDNRESEVSEGNNNNDGDSNEEESSEVKARVTIRTRKGIRRLIEVVHTAHRLSSATTAKQQEI